MENNTGRIKNVVREDNQQEKNQEPVLVLVSIDSIIPAPENDEIYRAIAWNDPEILALARSIKERGVQEPILISRDGYILSGHRRRYCRSGVAT
jgi:ParB-like nuclease domain